MIISAVMFIPLCWGMASEQEWTIVGRNGKPVRTQHRAVVEASSDEIGWRVFGEKGEPLVTKKSGPSENSVSETSLIVLDDGRSFSYDDFSDFHAQYYDKDLRTRENHDDYGLSAYPVWVRDFDETYTPDMDIGYQPVGWMSDDLEDLGLHANYRLIDLKCDIDVNFVHEAMGILNLSGNESEEINLKAIGIAWFRQNLEIKNARPILAKAFNKFGCPKQTKAEYYIDSTKMNELLGRLSNKSSLFAYLSSFDKMDGFACMFLDVALNYIMYKEMLKLESTLKRLIDDGRHITLEEILYAQKPNSKALAAMAVSRSSDWTKQVGRLQREIFVEYSSRMRRYFERGSAPTGWLTDLAERVSPSLLAELFDSADIVYTQQDPPSPSTCIPRIGWTLINLLEAVQYQIIPQMEAFGTRLSESLLTLEHAT